MQVAIDEVRVDGGTQPRAELSIEVIEDYAEQMLRGAEFPPVVVFFDGKEYWLADGFHRLAAFRQSRLGRSIDVEVIQGTQSEAQWYSFSVNQTHGARRTREDKERAIKAALRHPFGAEQSDNQIAKHVGVDHKTVAKYRAALQSSWEIPKIESRTVQRGESTYQQNTTKIGRTNGRPSSTNRSSPAIHSPTRMPNPVEKMTALSMPHNPVMGACTLIEVFDADYLRVLTDEIRQYLQKNKAQSLTTS